MKKITFIALSLVILISAHEVSAVSDNANDKASANPSLEVRNENSVKEVPSVTPISDNSQSGNSNKENESEDSTSNNLSECSEVVKNHGEYVSCVAKTHPGGEEVSEAARSLIGKKTLTNPSITPSLSQTTTISPTPTDDPDATPSPTLTGSPTPTPIEQLEKTAQRFEKIAERLEALIEKLKDLFNL